MPDKRKAIDLSNIDQAALRKALEEKLTDDGRGALEPKQLEVFRAEDIKLTPPMIGRLLDDHGPVGAVRVNDARLDGSEAGGIVKIAVIAEYVYGVLGLTLGIASILGGVVLGLNGVAGNTSLTAKLLGFSIGVNDAVPGVILFVVGAIFIYITRPDVNLKKLH